MKRLLRRFQLVLALGLVLCGPTARAQLTILSQPGSLLNLLNLGQAVNLAVTAASESTTNLQYQWKRNGVLIANATNSTFAIPSAQVNDCGAFSVQISDGIDSVETVPTSVIPSFLNELLGSVLSLLNLGSGQIRSSNVGVTNTAGIPAIIPGVAPEHPMVMEWTPLLGGTVTFSTLGSDFDTIMGAYTMEGTNFVAVPSAVSDDDSAGFLDSTVSFNSSGLTEYYIVVDGFRGATGDIVVSWTEDILNILDPESYPVISSMPAPVTTVAPGASATLAGQWGKSGSIWLFNGQTTATVNTNTFNLPSAGDSTVGNYIARVSGVGGLTSETRAASLQINLLQDGTTATNSFAFPKFLDAAAAPFVQPAPQQQHVKTGGGDSRGYTCSQTFSTVGSSEEPGEPSICGQIGGSPQWYAYVAPESGSILIDTSGSSFNTMIGVYVGSGSSFSALTNVGCGYTTNYTRNGQPLVSVLNVTAGQTNYIQVDGYHGASGTVHLNIHLGSPVRIVNPPQDQSISPSGSATFTAVVMGATNLYYAWMFNGALIPGANAPVLTIPNVQQAEQGTYSVLVSNLVSMATASATLSLQVAPAITNQPVSQIVPAGSPAALSVGATGQPAPSYQWLFDGQMIGTNSVLTISSFAATNAGNYEVIVSNAAGAVTSSIATLTLQTSPLITNQPQSQIVAAGAATTLSVGAAAQPSPSYEWLFNGQFVGTNASLTINNFSAADAGNYEVILANAAGSITSQIATLTLASAPVITNEPLSHILPPGASATLTVAASGLPTPSYQWFYNGQPVGTNGASLVIENFGQGNVGNYAVIAANAAGYATSEVATLALAVAPVITNEPVRRILPPGASNTLTVGATGLPAPSYQWLFNGQPIGTNGAELTINSFGAGNAGNYQVILANAAGSTTSEVATLTLAIAPVITNQPDSRILPPSASTTLTVGASGFPIPSYQWFYNGQPIGTNGPSLAIENFTTTNVGDYEVVLANAAGSATSEVATLTLPVAPTITNEPIGQPLALGASTTLAVGAVGTPALAYQWLFNGQAVGSNSATLEIANFQSGSAGSYAVVVTNMGGAITSSVAVLSVYEAPIILLQPLSQTVSTGTATRLTVAATGSPSPDYQWFYKGQPVGANSAVLNIANFSAANVGSYQVIVSNAAGTVTSSVASLTALVAPSGPAAAQTLSVANGQLNINFSGVAGAEYIIQTSTDLVNWTEIATVTTASGSFNWSDCATNADHRFYRAVQQ